MELESDIDPIILRAINSKFPTKALNSMVKAAKGDEQALAGLKTSMLETAMQRAGGFTSGFAGGGIAKLAGINEGPPPESGPNSQGLSGLLKRGNKI